MADNEPRISIIRPIGPSSGPVQAILPPDANSITLAFSNAFVARVRRPVPNGENQIRDALDR